MLPVGCWARQHSASAQHSEGRMNASQQISPHPAILEPNVVVRGNGVSFAQEIVAAAHHLPADEPCASGGTDSGPNPYALLPAALGARPSMTLGMYARSKNW